MSLTVDQKFERVKTFFFPPFPLQTASNANTPPLLQQGRERILLSMFRISFTLSLLLLPLFLISDISTNPYANLAYTALEIPHGWIALDRRVPFRIKSIVGYFMLFGVALVDLLTYGIADFGTLMLLITCIYVQVVWDIRAAIINALASAIVVFGVGLATFYDIIEPAGPYGTIQQTFDNSLVTAIAFFFATSFALSIVEAFVANAYLAWQRERKNIHSLEQQSEQLNAALERETKLTKALNIALHREQELNALRDKVINTVAHEFRTPLTVIRTSADIMSMYNDRLTAVQRSDKLANVKTAVQQIDHLLSGAVALESSGREEIIPSIQTVNTQAIYTRLQLLAESMSQAGRDILVFDSTGDNTEVATDLELIVDLCKHLLENSLKFSAETIRLTVSCQYSILEIEVADNGIGVPDGDEKRIFEPLYRADNAETITGIGVGLFLANRIALELGGRIDLTHNRAPTVFLFTQPMQTAEMLKPANSMTRQ